MIKDQVYREEIRRVYHLYFYFSYKQQKFNLFREECEGYAKLITELNQVCQLFKALKY